MSSENIKINAELCVGCGECEKECPVHIIKVSDGKAHAEDSCIKCGHCYAVCPQNAIEWEDGEKASTPFSNFLYARRSVRKYKDKKIGEEMLKNIVSASCAYPSATNQKCICVTAIEDEELLKEIRQDVIESVKRKFRLLDNKYINMAAKKVLGSFYKKAMRYKKLFEGMDEEHDELTFSAPCLVFVHGNKKKICIDEDAHYVAYNMVLCAMEQGIGSCFMGFIRGFMSKKMKSRLGIPDEHKIYSAFILGYPDVSFRRNVPQPKIDFSLYN